VGWQAYMPYPHPHFAFSSQDPLLWDNTFLFFSVGEWLYAPGSFIALSVLFFTYGPKKERKKRANTRA
jgi:hypothetical protein